MPSAASPAPGLPPAAEEGGGVDEGRHPGPPLVHHPLLAPQRIVGAAAPVLGAVLDEGNVFLFIHTNPGSFINFASTRDT